MRSTGCELPASDPYDWAAGYFLKRESQLSTSTAAIFELFYFGF